MLWHAESLAQLPRLYVDDRYGSSLLAGNIEQIAFCIKRKRLRVRDNLDGCGCCVPVEEGDCAVDVVCDVDLSGTRMQGNGAGHGSNGQPLDVMGFKIDGGYVGVLHVSD